MLCDICHKREATIHVTEIINNEVQEIHVCEECAEKKGMVTKQNFGLAGFLGGLADFGFTSEEEAVNEVELKCPGCGLTLTDFKKIGRLGCDRCYETFQKALLPLLRKIHGTAQHSGKMPAGTGKELENESDLGRLERELKRAIEEEEFEEAAKIRDKIRDLKEKNKREKKDEA
ncbi:MAG: UvrB/UvrC motif-containing protein [Candidatus Omnitrophica bacterium]|nr:UvrB/UvrC motif-containing protein [Candidatus Omnitrophota bacterium]